MEIFIIIQIVIDFLFLILISILLINRNKYRKSLDTMYTKMFKLQKGIAEMYEDINKLLKKF